MCIVCLNCINLYLWSKRAVVFDLLTYYGGGEPKKKSCLHGNRKATRKKSTVGAPWIDWRGCALKIVGVGCLEQLTLWKMEQQSDSISVVFPMKCQREDCGLLLSGLWPSSHVTTLIQGIKARITPVTKTSWLNSPYEQQPSPDPQGDHGRLLRVC